MQYNQCYSVLTEFDSFEILNADTADETKTCHDKICPLIFVETIPVFSTSVDRPLVFVFNRCLVSRKARSFLKLFFVKENGDAGRPVGNKTQC